MAQQTINIGASPNDGTGTPLRTAFQYTNSNFSELYTAVGPSGNNIVVPGSATITGDLAVRTNKLYVTATGVGCGMTPITPLSVSGAGGIILFRTTDPSAPVASPYLIAPVSTGFSSTSPVYGYWYQSSGIGNPAVDAVSVITASNERYRIAADGIATWSNVGGVAGTAMTLNSTGLGIGMGPANNLSIGSATYASFGVKIDSITQSSLIFKGTPDAAGYEHAKIVSGRESSPFTYGSFLAFYTEGKNSGTTDTSTERLRIDSSGNVGIGVTPSAWGASYKGLQLKDSYAGLFANTSSGISELVSNAYNDGAWKFANAGNGAARYQMDALNRTHAWFYAATSANPITWTQAMTLDASGNLLVGTTTAGAKITALAGASGQAAIFQQPAQNFWCVLAHNQATSGDNSFVLFGTEASFTSRGSITYNRAAGQVSYNITSDYRLKEDVKPLTGALNRISSLKPSTYKFKETGFTCEGFIAHELAEVIPAAVTGEKDAVNEDGSIKAQGVDLSKVVPVLVAAIQELTARVQTLETR